MGRRSPAWSRPFPAKNPVITWTARRRRRDRLDDHQIDGKATLVYGPYGTKTHANYAGALAGLNLAAGSHTFVIHATDSAGTPVATQYSGTFDVVAAVNSGPTISSVVTAVAGANPVITWTLDDADGIASATIEVDGKATLVYGPYGTKTHANYAGAGRVEPDGRQS